MQSLFTEKYLYISFLQLIGATHPVEEDQGSTPQLPHKLSSGLTVTTPDISPGCSPSSSFVQRGIPPPITQQFATLPRQSHLYVRVDGNAQNPDRESFL